MAEDADFVPAWPAAHDPVMRKPVDEQTRLWITEPDAAAYLDIANATYGAMLSVLAQTFGNADEEEKSLLMRVSVELMEASASVSAALARMPANPERPGVNAGMTFAVPRSAAPRPLAARARPIFLERVAELRVGAQRVLAGEVADKVLRRLGNAAELLDGSKSPD